MGQVKKFSMWDLFLVKTLLILSTLILNSYGETEFCIKGGSDPVYWINTTNCAFGFLLMEPVSVDCLATTDSGLKADVCKDTDVELNPDPGKAIQFQYIPQADASQVTETCNAEGENKCGIKGHMVDQWTRGGRPTFKNRDDPWPDSSSGIVNDASVGNQTMRMFKNLMGMTDNGDIPVLRIITLLRKSFQILAKFCIPPYVPTEFGDDIFTAFMFLLSEADTSKIIDVPLEDYRRIDKALNDCLDQKNPFKFIGSSCRIHADIEGINTTSGEVVIYENDEFSWKADKYDIPVDITWATADFVHGLCYGTFKDHVNSHHLFQQAIERIFTSEILFRWEKPILLARQELYDNFFSANVRNAVHNLEYCIKASYHDAPFLHRLERAVHKYKPPSTSGRKKRSVYPLPRRDKLKFWCFNTEEFRDKTLDQYKKALC